MPKRLCNHSLTLSLTKLLCLVVVGGGVAVPPGARKTAYPRKTGPQY